MDGRNVARLVRVAVALAVASWVTPLSATTLVRAGLEELTAANHTVVMGEVLETRSYWNVEGTFILTDVRIAPIELLKGHLRQGEITVTVMGGTVGDLTTLIVGGAELVPGRSYLVFLNRENLPGAKGVLTVRDHGQGVFDIVASADGLRAVSQVRIPLLPDARGLSEPPGGVDGLPLGAMLDSIRGLAGEREVQR
jgi:hypothetical protein